MFFSLQVVLSNLSNMLKRIMIQLSTIYASFLFISMINQLISFYFVPIVLEICLDPKYPFYPSKVIKGSKSSRPKIEIDHCPRKEKRLPLTIVLLYLVLRAIMEDVKNEVARSKIFLAPWL